MKQLKRELAQLKTNRINGEEILFVSRLIRQRIKPGHAIPEIMSSESELIKNFWKTCKGIFHSIINKLPEFHIDKCFGYFQQSLAQVNKCKYFKVPSWMASLPCPSLPCNNYPPTYQEVARAVRKSKSTAPSIRYR